MFKPIAFISFVFFLGPTIYAQARTTGFEYLKISKNSIETDHGANYKIKIDRSFKFLGQFSHQPTYGDKQFNVSFAAFTDGKDLIMIHAEKHSDGTGGLDYSDLSPTGLTGLAFTSRDQCAEAEDGAELDANPQIIFIRERGFAIKTPFFIKQFFTTDNDGTAEVVISYGRAVDGCARLDDGFEQEIMKQIHNNIRVSRLNLKAP